MLSLELLVTGTWTHQVALTAFVWFPQADFLDLSLLTVSRNLTYRRLGLTIRLIFFGSIILPSSATFDIYMRNVV